MTLKERVRTWLAVPGTPAPKPSPAGLNPPLALAGSGQRLRLTQDNPTVSYLQGLTLFSRFDPEQRWRGLNLDEAALDNLSTPQILDMVADLSPEMSRALWDLLRLVNPGWDVNVYRVGSTEEVVDDRAQAAVDAFMAGLKERHGSADVVINRLFMGAFMRGAFMAELVLSNNGRVPLDLAVPDAQWTYFRIYQDPQVGPVWEPYQFQGGNPVSLMRPTIRYVPVDPLPATPTGRAPAAPGLFPALFTLMLLHDLKRVVAQQGYPRIDMTVSVDELVKLMPPDLAADPAEKLRWVTAQVQDIQRNYATLQPDDAYVHTSTVQVNKNVGTVDASSLSGIGAVIEFLERQLTRALKSSPLLMGLSGSSNETQANRQHELIAAGVKSLQHPCEGLLEHLLTLALQAQGLQGRVQFRFAELRAAELLRDAQVASLRSQTAYFNYVAGWWSQDESCQYATEKDKAAVPEPRAAPQPISPTGSKVTDPGTVQSEPGGNRAAELVTSGNGRHG